MLLVGNNRHTRDSFTQVLSYYGQLPFKSQRLSWIESELSHDVLNPARVPF